MADISQLIGHFHRQFEEKTRAFDQEKMFFHRGSAGMHTGVDAMVKFNELCYELLTHLPYSPNLTPSDYF